MEFRVIVASLILSLTNIASASVQKWQITLDMTLGQVSLNDAQVVDGFPKLPSPDLTNLYYLDGAMTRQAEMMPYRILDNFYQELDHGVISDTEVLFKCSPHMLQIDPSTGEMVISRPDLLFFEVTYNPSAKWIEIIRNRSIYTLDLLAPQGYAAARITRPATIIGSPVEIINNGPSSQKIDLVIIGDGWGNLPAGDPDSIVNYRNLVTQIAPMIFQGGWHNGHANNFNVWRIDVDGSFGATPYSMWPSSINDLYAMAGRLPVQFDQIMLIVKDSGYLSPPTRPRANLTDLFTMWDGPSDFYPSIADVTRHELGHTLGQMADEYGAFGSPTLVPYPAGPVRAAGVDVIWDNLTVWGRVGDLATLTAHRPFWGRLLGTHAVLDRPLDQDHLHHWYWDIGSFEGGAMADLDIWRSDPTGAMCCGGGPWNSIPYDVMTKHTLRFIPLAPQLTGAVTLTSPTPGSSISGDRMTFRWLPVLGATDYHLVIRKLFTGEVFFSIPTKDTQLEIYTAGLDRGQPHTWTVIASNNNNETPLSNWNIFAFVPNQPYSSPCGDLDRDGILTLDDVDILAAILYRGAWADEYVCIAGDVDSDAALLHTKDFPNDFGDLEILRYWATCNPTQNPQGCGTAPGHQPGQIPPLPTCTTLPGTAVANCIRTFTCGDYNMDGNISVLDALGIAQNSAGLASINPSSPTAFQRCAAGNPSGNQQIDILDALLISKQATGLPGVLICPILEPVGGPGGPLPTWCSQ